MFYTRLKEYLISHPARRDKFFVISGWLNIGLYLVIWFVVLVMAQPVSRPLVLHYNIYFGIDFLGPWPWLLVFPVISSVLVVVDFVLGFWLYVRERFLSLL